MVGSFQKSRNCVRTTMKDAQQITCQSSRWCTRHPYARTTMYQQETVTQHPHAVADHGRRQHLTTTDLRDLIRQSLPLHLLGSRVVNKCTVLFKTMSGIFGRALNATSRGEAQRHGTLWTIKQWKRSHTTCCRCDVQHSSTLCHREFLMLIPMGRSEDIRLALRRREQREMKNKKSNVANYLEAQWSAWQSITERQPGELRGRRHRTTARPSTERFSERRQRCDVLRTMRDVRESVAAHSPDHGSTGPRDEAEQSHSACVYSEATGRNRTLLLSARTREHDDAGHAATEPLLGMLDVQYHLRTQPGRVRCSTCRPEELRGCRREHGSHWGRRSTVPLNVQGQLKDVDQEVYLQLIYEIGQRAENQITTLGLASRQKVESGEQVTELLNVPEGFSQLHGARFPTDKVGPSPGTSGH